MVRKQILEARKVKRTEALNNNKNRNSIDRPVLNITYYPAFAKLKNILSAIHLLLTPDKTHQKVFKEIPIVGFRRGKSLKDILVRAKVPPLKVKQGCCGPCKKPRCQICNFIVETNTFTSTTTNKSYKIRPENLNCNSEKVVYLYTCKTCHKQYTGSSVEFRARFNNYRSAHRNYKKNKKVLQESFHEHFERFKHNGENDWEVRLIDQAESVEDLRKRESFWQHELKTFQPDGLNECEVPVL